MGNGISGIENCPDTGRIRSGKGIDLKCSLHAADCHPEYVSGTENLGFQKGNILEPSMGVGNFFGMLPENLSQSKLYGVELDDISGRIAKLLYPDANIQIKGYEKTDYPNDFFDVAIGNVPFGAYKVNDRQYDRYNFMIHDYFLAKSIDQLRPGGVAALITTKGTMDKASPEVRNIWQNVQICLVLSVYQILRLRQMQAQRSVQISYFSRNETVSIKRCRSG